MAQSDYQEDGKVNRISSVQMTEDIFASSDVMTGDRNQSRYLYYQLKNSIRNAASIDIIVSFLMESGVEMLLTDLKYALRRGVRIRILTGNYLGITQPSALYLIKKELGDQVELRFYNEKGRSFHPKAYIFHYEKNSEIYIGSSNISRSALTSGIEWNYRFRSDADEKNYELFSATFEDLYQNHSVVIDKNELERYSKSWHKPAVARELSSYDAAEDVPLSNVESLFKPRGAQIEALYALESSREEGAEKGLVCAATGVGKTYLAAFDSLQYKRVLFVAHREEILQQAARSFENVRKSEDYGFFTGQKKETKKAVIFASVATLGQKNYLNDEYFSKDYFDYIVIDEFHHAVNEQYQNVFHYFKPKFLLGLTATPERLDGKNIYELCDYNVPYEISLAEAINKGLLVPFHYYGIYDDTDYSGLKITKGRYSETELLVIYRNNKRRNELIFKQYQKYRSKRALGFCSSRQHAEDMAEDFCKRGVPAAAVYSNAEGTYSENRSEAVDKLKNGELQVIFSVDMFNEGLDVPSVDMVMFLRPTESPVVFLQQLGRGLRTSAGKEYLNVLDFIGNYEKAGRAPFLLGGQKGCADRADGAYQDITYPDDCIVDFDLDLIDLFDKLRKRTKSVKDRIRQEYYRVKDFLDNKVPTRMELFTYMDVELYQYCLRNAKENPFHNYLSFLKSLGELTAEEEKLAEGLAFDFLSTMETTNMSKVYKMPILYSFYNHGDCRLAVTDEEVLESWKEFFDTGTNWKDFDESITLEGYRKMTDRQHLQKAKQMPIHFLMESGKGFFVAKEGYALALREDLKEVIGNPEFRKQMKDILEYRTMAYYRRRYERE